MPALPPALDKLAALLARLPGIGERSATRLAFHILSEPAGYAAELARALDGLGTSVGFCEDCHMVAEQGLCKVCNDPGRDPTVLCIVSGISDLMAIERTGSYRGRYHVLHGVLAPLKGIGPSQLRLANLPGRIGRDGVDEVIVATDTGVEGEATALYLGRLLAGSVPRLTRIATGVPHGGDLEYIDATTLGRALEGRRPL
ncbi:MAG: recombination mediator RecR [Myxococcota bacterium]|jgi:recombination protein RecR|nr:recombination mediator RecR [Myxococcota bacterium]